MDGQVKSDFRKEASECIRAGATCHCIKGDEPCEKHQLEAIVLALQSAYNRGVEDSATLAEKSFVKHEGYAYLLEDKIRQLKQESL